MDHDRRSFLSLSALTPIVAALPALLVPEAGWAQSGRASERPFPMPPPKDAQAAPPAPANADPKILLAHNQQEMKQDIDKLYVLVQDLKAQVDRTDSTSVLSLNLVDRAKKVEDLAKQIRNLARA